LNSTSKKYLISFLKVVLPLALGFYLLWHFYTAMDEPTKEVFFLAVREADYFWIALSLLIGLGSHLVRAYRWKYLLEPMDLRPKFLHRYHALMVGYLVNLIIPRAGEATRAALLYRTDKIPFSKLNTETVIGIENSSRNSIAYTLEGVLDFMNNRHKDMTPKYKVFKEVFVVCWAGHKKKVRDKTFLSRVDIELINEQVKLFYSALDDVTIEFDDKTFAITEYVPLGLNDRTSYYPLERQTLTFFDNGYYKIETEFLFEPPQYNKKMMFHIYNSNLSLLHKLQKNISLSDRELKDVINLPSTLMICYLNGFEQAKQKLIDAKPFLKAIENSLVYVNFKEALRILRKMKYDKQPT
jgi:hypothetical protein